LLKYGEAAAEVAAQFVNARLKLEGQLDILMEVFQCSPETSCAYKQEEADVEDVVIVMDLPVKEVTCAMQLEV
jgi:hypothetical protein